MAFRKRIYVSYDADDLIYFNMLQAWCGSETQELSHYKLIVADNDSPRFNDNVSNTLREKIAPTLCVIVLVSEHSATLRPQMRMELDKAIELGKPIIVVNLNGKRSIDNDLCPAVLKTKMVLHISFNAKIIQKAIDTWPIYYSQNKEKGKGSFFFKSDVYKKLGL